ncbi:YjcZ family sporulation protein [Brevibacillus choshinensis]|uniref:YjcZ family sporulation protein n=1 Tax=Brevibacillus choshinensis TaxID=54911 RepID=A0ABX7FVG3_BRECH|nr:YjcZ family sporulation protein [Brevibacillus choshinensis]
MSPVSLGSNNAVLILVLFILLVIVLASIG